MAAPESNQPPSTGSPAVGLWRMPLFLIVLLGLYVLSPGPVLRIYKGVRPPAPLIALLRPLEYSYDHNDGVKKVYDWYFKFWGLR